MRDDVTTTAMIVSGLFLTAALALPARGGDAASFEAVLKDMLGAMDKLSATLSAATLLMLWRRVDAPVRVTAALAVLSILWAWATAQYPDLLVGSVTVSQGAAPHATLVALVVALTVGSMVLIPALGLLFWVVRRPATTAL